MDYNLIITNIIAFSGECESCMMEAIELARCGKFEEAENARNKGNEALIKAHEAHTKLLFAEANGERVEINLLLIHASNHMSNAEMLVNVAECFINSYKTRG